MADPQLLKQIKIKTGVVKRLTREKFAYESEVVTEEKKVAKMKDENRDQHDIAKQEEVLQESKMMIPDCLRRLRAAVDDLQRVLDSEKALEEHEDYKTALSVIEEGKKVLAAS